MKYQVNFPDRAKKYATLEAAKIAAERYFLKTGIVLSITEKKK